MTVPHVGPAVDADNVEAAAAHLRERRMVAPVEGTMLVATHDIALALELCERAVILSGGRVAADGVTREVLADERLLAAHDLRIPTGLDPVLIETRPRPGAAERVRSLAGTPAAPLADGKPL